MIGNAVKLTVLIQDGLFRWRPLPFTCLLREYPTMVCHYGGIAEDVTRVGHAIGSNPTSMRRIYRYPTLGNQII